MQSNGFVLWFTGLSGAGKTTVAKAVIKRLKVEYPHQKTERLDGDIIREHLTKDLGFSKTDRQTNLGRVRFVAQLLSRNNVGVLSSFISPYKEDREIIRDMTTNFIEVFVNAPLEVCESRDIKGLYQKARAGEIKEFTGISDPYEAPENHEIELRTDLEEIDESAEKVIEYLIQNGFLASVPLEGRASSF